MTIINQFNAILKYIGVLYPSHTQRDGNIRRSFDVSVKVDYRRQSKYRFDTRFESKTPLNNYVNLFVFYKQNYI